MRRDANGDGRFLHLVTTRANRLGGSDVVTPDIDGFRKVDVRPPGKGNSNSHGARPVHLIITMIKAIRTSRLSIKKTLSTWCRRTLAPRLWNSIRVGRPCLPIERWSS